MEGWRHVEWLVCRTPFKLVAEQGVSTMHEAVGITLRDWVVGSCMYRDR